MDSFWEIWNYHEKVGRKKNKKRHCCISNQKFSSIPKNNQIDPKDKILKFLAQISVFKVYISHLGQTIATGRKTSTQIHFLTFLQHFETS